MSLVDGVLFLIKIRLYLRGQLFNTMKNILTLILMLIVLCACDNLYESLALPEDSVCIEGSDVEPIPDSVNVNSYELQRVIDFVNKNEGMPLSRSEGKALITTVYDNDGNEAIYVVNNANDGGFYLISARKDGYPVLAFNTVGNFRVDSMPIDLEFWMEATAEEITNMPKLYPDSALKNRSVWHSFEKKSQINEGHSQSRSIDESELTELYGIMMDSTVVWSSRNE